MRIAHLTDLHFYTAPKPSDLMHIKRIMGTVNLFLLGRKKKFSLNVQKAAVQKLAEQKPDFLIITGDLTSQALDAEFRLAREVLDPLLQTVPAVVIGGNHDLYVQSEPTTAMRDNFGERLHESTPHLYSHENIAMLHVETCKPDLLSRGYVNPSHLDSAAELLQNAREQHDFIFLCTHYPVWNRRGEHYGPQTRAIQNGPMFAEWIKQQPVDALLHGHEHHGYRIDIQGKHNNIVSLNPGSSGYNHDMQRDRRAHFNIYTIEDGSLQNIERFRYNEQTFESEPNGAYATGR